MLSVFHQLIPPSGVEFAVFLRLREPSFSTQNSTYIIHLVVARDNLLRIYELREHLEKVDDGTQDEKQTLVCVFSNSGL